MLGFDRVGFCVRVMGVAPGVVTEMWDGGGWSIASLGCSDRC